MSSHDYTVYTDGGSSRGGVAAGACVIDGHLSGRRRGAVVFLGEATNNEAEITASLLAFSFVKLAAEKRKEPGSVKLHWVADSEYALKSAKDYIHNWQRNGWKTASKEPVKNQGLWRAYLSLTKNFNISTEHVRGHTGHPENELCDLAANWAKEYAEESLSAGPCKVEIPDAELGFWYLVDGREFLQALRDGDEPREVYEELAQQLSLCLKSGPREENSASNQASKSEPSDADTLLVELEAIFKKHGKAKKSSAKKQKLLEKLKFFLQEAKEL